MGLHERLAHLREIQKLERSKVQAMLHAEGGQRVVVADTGADPARLRGIPAIGRTVTGAVPGTDPEREALHRVARQERGKGIAQGDTFR